MTSLFQQKRGLKRWSLFALLFPIISVFSAMLLADGDAQTVTVPETSMSFFLKIPEDGMALTHGKLGHGLKAFPDGIKSLAGTPLANTLGLMSRIRDMNGNLVGLASELEYFPQKPKSDGSPVWDTYWTLMIAGRGTLFLYEKESLGPKVADVFFNAKNRRASWTGSLTWPSNVGPEKNGHGTIVGGTGEFTNMSGTFEEIGTLLEFTPKGELTADIEIRLHFSSESGAPETTPHQ